MRHAARAVSAAIGLMAWAACAPAQVVPSAERNPLAPAAQQVQARFARVEQEVERLRAAGQGAEADAMAARLQHFRDQLAGGAASRVVAPELSIVGVYDPGNVTVNVRRTDRPTVLALTSNHRVNWRVNLEEGANLQRVIVSGNESVSRPANLPDSVPVEIYSPQTAVSPFYAYARRFDSGFTSAAQRLYALTRLPVSTFQGRYNAHNATFTVGSGNEDWTAQHVLTEMLPLYKEATAFGLAQDRAAAESYRFTGVAQTYSPRGYPAGSVIAEFSPLGPVRTVAAVSARHVAVDPRGPTYYVGDAHSIGRVGGPAGTTPLGNIEWLTGLTFDTQRNRLVASSLSGEGFLAFFSLDPNRWSGQVSVNNVDMWSTTYSANDDALYALAEAAGGVWQVLKYSPTGQRVGTINLSEAIPSRGGQNSPWDYQLAATGDRLSLITPPIPNLYEPHLPPQQHSYLINAATGAVTYLGVIPEPGALMALGFFAGVAALRRRR